MADTPHDLAEPPLTVLVVDDEPAIRDVLSSLLADEGYAVRQAADGVDALAIVEHDAIAVVLTDVQVPRLDGASLARHLRRRQRPVPVVLMSAAPAAVDVPDVDVLAKPFDFDRLLSVVAAFHAAAHHGAPPPLAPPR